MSTATSVFDLTRGRRYRLRWRNTTDDVHPIHLHRNTFEITHIAGTATAGLRKDVVMLGGYREMTIDVLAEQAASSDARSTTRGSAARPRPRSTGGRSEATAGRSCGWTR
ncbi:multicopper oxidase domain-containing protein [Nocardia vaccinii]|uniref:multicopper oxidase domain-containing protein n=1 Tax=Nocardia vaccinii TaxID=1822 RepID=UPI0008311337|nr:multicopper oxidase domain-containing protein [Nocardia vaccinii]